MSADFNAGSIEGTLDLDTRPFVAGLHKAQAQADEFEKTRRDARLGLDSTAFNAERDKASAELDKLGAKTATPDIELRGAAKTEAELAAVNRELDKTKRHSEGLGLGGFLGGFSRVALIGGGLASVAAAAGPATAAVVAFGAAAATAFGGAILSIGLFAKVVTSDFARIQKAIKAGTDLKGPAGAAEQALKHLTKAWSEFQKASGGVGYKFLAVAFNGLADVLPRLEPLLRATGKGLTGVVQQILALTKTKGFSGFIGELSKMMTGLTKGFGTVAVNGIKTFFNVFKAMQPLMTQVGHGILALSDAAKKFSAGPGLAKFLGQAEHALPVLARLGKDLMHTLGSISKGLAPLSGPALGFIDKLVRALGQVNLAPLAKGLGDLLNGLGHALPQVVGVINKITPALGALASGLGKVLANKTAVNVLMGLGGAFLAFKGVSAAASGINNIAKGITGIVDAAKNVGSAVKWIKELGIVEKIAAGATKVMAAAQAVLDAAMDANPIGLVVVAIAALAAGLIYAYKHSETFRRIVNAAFHGVAVVAKAVFNWLKNAVSDVINFIKAHWELLVGIFAGPLGVVVALVISHWSQIKSFVSNAMSAVEHFVSSSLSNVAHFFSSLPGRIAGFFGNMVSAGVHFFSGVFDGIKQVGGEILSWCESLPSRIIAAIGNIGGAVLSHVEGSITSSLSGIGGFISSHVHIPHLASGGITSGRMLSMIGDNAGGREAVVPLDKYDLPRKGDTAALAAAASASNREELRQLRATVSEQTSVLKAILDKTGIASVDLSEASRKALIQTARAT